MYRFSKFIGIDYSGAKTINHRLTGLRVFSAINLDPPQQVYPSAKSGELWSRALLADWLCGQLVDAKQPCLVGIDHAFSFPENYFRQHNIATVWDSFLNDFCTFWPSDKADVTVRELLLRNESHSEGRTGNSRWRRTTEQFSKGAKSVFHFSVPGSVASSTHAGIPWLHKMRKHPALREAIHFWPFDGWQPDTNKHVVAEVYPSLWNKQFASEQRTQDEHDAWVVCRALQTEFAQSAESLWFNPRSWSQLRPTENQLRIARYEGWILGLH